MTFPAFFVVLAVVFLAPRLPGTFFTFGSSSGGYQFPSGRIPVMNHPTSTWYRRAMSTTVPTLVRIARCPFSIFESRPLAMPISSSTYFIDKPLAWRTCMARFARAIPRGVDRLSSGMWIYDNCWHLSAKVFRPRVFTSMVEPGN